MSTSRMISESTWPPKYPEMRPSAVPMIPPTKIATSETVSETRAPWIRRLRLSRPSLSVPSRLSVEPPTCQTGGRRRLASDPLRGSYGAIWYANTAGMTRRSIRSPTGIRG
jgi:hypothetical protein